MKEWKHLSLDQRKVISSGIAHNFKAKMITESLGFDPTSISKKVKRNRIAIAFGLNTLKEAIKTISISTDYYDF